MVRFIKKDIKINIYIYKMNVVIKWKDHSPRSFINKVIYEPVPKKKKGKKVKGVDFKIIEMKNYQTLLDLHILLISIKVYLALVLIKQWDLVF